jgi:hypothetical protein
VLLLLAAAAELSAPEPPQAASEASSAQMSAPRATVTCVMKFSPSIEQCVSRALLLRY